MLSIEVDDRAVKTWLDRAPAKAQSKLEQTIHFLTQRLRNHVIADKLRGQVLRRITGRLGQSIQERVESRPNEVTGIVYSSGDVPYARIHEYGGVIHHPGGTPYFVSLLAARAVFVRKNTAFSMHLPVTAAHLINIPERSYMRSALTDQNYDIVQRIRKAIGEGAKE